MNRPMRPAYREPLWLSAVCGLLALLVTVELALLLYAVAP